MEDDFATLADKRIFPGDVLWVKDSIVFENRDIAGEVTIMRDLNISENMRLLILIFCFPISDEISGQKTDVLPAEEGFRGTLLTSSVSTQLCEDTTECVSGCRVYSRRKKEAKA